MCHLPIRSRKDAGVRDSAWYLCKVQGQRAEQQGAWGAGSRVVGRPVLYLMAGLGLERTQKIREYNAGRVCGSCDRRRSSELQTFSLGNFGGTVRAAAEFAWASREEDVSICISET